MCYHCHSGSFCSCCGELIGCGMKWCHDKACNTITIRNPGMDTPSNLMCNMCSDDITYLPIKLCSAFSLVDISVRNHYQLVAVFEKFRLDHNLDQPIKIKINKITKKLSIE